MLPDCIAMEITEAKNVLEAVGISDIAVHITQPPKGGIPEGIARVVRVRQLSDSSCELVVAYREYLREIPC
ncbi:MAG TPA: hypothetical protein VFF14_11650 [Candidatus Deferrimicrobium sp.]|nr:hypothetical protein [Candidatus Deferrimicrobium sp.]